MPVEDMRLITMFEGAELYFAASDGFIYSKKSGEAKRLACHKNKHGYLHVTLYSNGRQIKRCVHSIIANTFHGARQNGLVCRHLDGNKQNNKPENLKWGTCKENSEDSRIHGIMCMGEDHYMSSCTDSDIETIKTLATEGVLLTEIGKMFGISKSGIHYIVTGKSRGYVRKDLTDKYMEIQKKTLVRVSAEDLKKAKLLRASGSTVTAAANAIGVSQPYLSRVLKGERRASC